MAAKDSDVILTDRLGDGCSEAEVEAAFIAEAKRRWEDIRSGKTKTIPWEDVNRKLRAMLDGARDKQQPKG